jgi:hypothetical protein
LNLAIEAGAVGVAEAALDRGADVGANRGRASATAEAAVHGLGPIVERLAPHAPQEDLDEALLEAAKGGYRAIVETLLKTNADPTFANQGGESVYGQASGPYREEIRALIRRALRERGTATAPALGVIGRARKNIAKLRGVRELVKSQTDANPDWVIIAVRKPIGEVSTQLASIYGAARLELDVAQRGVIGATAGVFVFSLRGHPWTIELRSIGFHHRGRWEVDEGAVATISREAACETLLCVGSDTSGTFGAFRYDRGWPVDKMEWTFDGVEAADAHFLSLELYLPGCRVDAGGVSARLDLIRIDPASVERLDYIILEE